MVKDFGVISQLSTLNLQLSTSLPPALICPLSHSITHWHQSLLLKKILFITCLLIITSPCYCWVFFAHKKINYYAVFLLAPQCLFCYNRNIEFISEHATDPDKSTNFAPFFIGVSRMFTYKLYIRLIIKISICGHENGVIIYLMCKKTPQ